MPDDLVIGTRIYRPIRLATEASGGELVLQTPAMQYFNDGTTMVRAVRFLFCKPCAETRLISEDDLPPGLKIGTRVTLIDLAADFQVFTF